MVEDCGYRFEKHPESDLYRDWFNHADTDKCYVLFTRQPKMTLEEIGNLCSAMFTKHAYYTAPGVEPDALDDVIFFVQWPDGSIIMHCRPESFRRELMKRSNLSITS
jgi:hypothetical protein